MSGVLKTSRDDDPLAYRYEVVDGSYHCTACGTVVQTLAKLHAHYWSRHISTDKNHVKRKYKTKTRDAAGTA